MTAVIMAPKLSLSYGNIPSPCTVFGTGNAVFSRFHVLSVESRKKQHTSENKFCLAVKYSKLKMGVVGVNHFLSFSKKTRKASVEVRAVSPEAEGRGSEENDKNGSEPAFKEEGEGEREGEEESGFSPSSLGEEEERKEEREGDWRIFRAKLVAQSQSEAGLDFWEQRRSEQNHALLSSQSPLLAQEPPWAHATWHPEPGGLLLAGPAMNLAIDERYWQAVVFLVQHSSEGSWGVILNRPSGYSIQEALPQAGSALSSSLGPFSGNPIYIGGFRAHGPPLHVMHGHRLEGAEEVVPGIFMGGLEAAAREVREGRLTPMDFRFFVGRVEWLPGKLGVEVEKREWFSASCSRSLVLKPCLRLPVPLWREVLALMGGEYAETAEREYGERQ